ncbi:hypothetical protein [Sphingobium yanoikuyae]|jgi:hypothetical protein|uniref:hypothetical protein n=1 Tax=Sphingobium yanoikuyae TaxID=13690 RepID=UPI0028A69FB1|nr:hypothetical protein [Sphingobium yanoikuyae]
MAEQRPTAQVHGRRQHAHRQAKTSRQAAEKRDFSSFIAMPMFVLCGPALEQGGDRS